MRWIKKPAEYPFAQGATVLSYSYLHWLERFQVGDPEDLPQTQAHVDCKSHLTGENNASIDYKILSGVVECPCKRG